MEMHHKLRRDPSWHPNACNLCGQLGHQAASCTSGTVNWRQAFGDDAFVLRLPAYWSEEQAMRKAKEVNHADLEKRAKEYAKSQAEAQGLDWDAMMAQAEVFRNQDPAEAIPRIVPAQQEEEPLPAGWASAQDPQGRTYFYHKKTMKTQWDRPTADTPIQ